MGYLKIKNKKDFVSNFLSPVSNLNDACILSIEEGKIHCTLASADATIVCKTSIDIETDLEDKTTLNLPDIKKLVRVLDIIPSADIELQINSNNLAYNKNGYKFKYHLLDDGIIKQPSLNVEKIKKLDFNTKFIVKESELNTLFKGSTFATETSKVYLFEEDNKLFSELGDRSRHNSDNFVCLLSDTYEGNIEKPLPINFDSFRLVSFGNSREVNFNVNTDMGVITCSFQKGDTQLIYIISALIN
jgi:hypothetical protein|tara:strand:+ start:494 stop:1228 length:735 start_codon:yes stop_codon:yes gene_type:complete